MYFAEYFSCTLTSFFLTSAFLGSRSDIFIRFSKLIMVTAAAVASAFVPISSPSPDSGGKSTKDGTSNLGGFKSKSGSRGLQVKANARAPPKINGTPGALASTAESVKNGDDMALPPPRTFINQLPDWSMLLAAITTIFLAAEKQWMMLDWKPKRPDMLVDPTGMGRIVQDGRVFRQKFSIRSYEIGADRMASIETLMNHLQVSYFTSNLLCIV